MKKVSKYLSYLPIKKNKLLYNLLLVSLSILLVIFLVYNIYKKITKKTLYVGCLYSKTGFLGNAPYDNYKILLDSFKYAINKYNANMLNIVPIYKDLGDDLENFSKWTEECIKKYNIKYFFGCWRSSERRHILPILEKYNARLFYPLQYEGLEASKNIYYFGACPNQQMIPGLQYMFATFYYYNDIHIVGLDYSYAKILTSIISTYVKTKKDYNKKIVSVNFFSPDQTDFSSSIKNIFTKSPQGAIIINLINGNPYYLFCKQFYEMYYSNFKRIGNFIYTMQDKTIKYLTNKDLKNTIPHHYMYPSISTSIVENSIDKSYAKYINHNLFVWNFTSQILVDPVYHTTEGYLNADIDYIFLIKFLKKQNAPVGDTQYFTFLSTLFFVKSIKTMIDKNLDINDTDLYDNNKTYNIFSVGGEHIMRPSNHISKTLFILHVNKNGEFEILYDSYKTIFPGPYLYLSDKIISVGIADNRFEIYDRLYG